MELKDYLRALRNHWIGSVIIVALLGLAAFGFSLSQPRVYAANANGFVTTGVSADTVNGSINDALSKSRATSYADIARSRAIARNAADRLDLDTDPSALVSRISVVQPVDTVLLKITATGPTPRQAQDLADAWVAALAEEVEEIEAPGDATPGPGTPQVVPIEQAELPKRPVSPDIPRNVLLGLVLGALLAAGYATIRSTLDRRLRWAEDVEEKFDVAVVGAIPVSKSLEPSAVTGVPELDPAAGEALRKLRTNLVYLDVDAPPRTLVVTSPLPGDGKSTIAANLARTIELTGETVVLIDADLRRPTQATRFGLDDAIGLTSVLSGQLPVDDALQTPDGTARLRVLTAGPLPPNPSELLSSAAWRSLVEQLSHDAVVVIDAPPLLPVTDAAVLGRAADGAFVVISHGRTRDDDLRHSLQALEAVSARALGVVINRVPLRARGYYGYGGAYGATPDRGVASPSWIPWRRGAGKRRSTGVRRASRANR